MYEVNAIIVLAAFQQPKSLFGFGYKMEGSKKLTTITYIPCLWVIFRRAYKSPSRYNNIISLGCAGTEVCVSLTIISAKSVWAKATNVRSKNNILGACFYVIDNNNNT